MIKYRKINTARGREVRVEVSYDLLAINSIVTSVTLEGDYRVVRRSGSYYQVQQLGTKQPASKLQHRNTLRSTGRSIWAVL